MDNLKPCPFCGGKAVIQQTGVKIMETNRDSVRFDFRIVCINCKATAPGAYGYISANLSRDGDVNVWHDDRPSAVGSWNRRTNDV